MRGSVARRLVDGLCAPLLDRALVDRGELADDLAEQARLVESIGRARLGGKEHQMALKDVGVDPARIFSLPPGFAVEDLVERDEYIEVVNDFLRKMGQGKQFTPADVSAGTPVAKAFADWAKTNNLRTPSKVEVGYALLGKSDLRLRPVGKNALIRLHGKFSTAFEAPAPSGAPVTK